MKKNILVILFLSTSLFLNAQGKSISSKNYKNIKGIVLDNKYQNDSIILNCALISPHYYEKVQIFSKVTNGKFNLNENFNYPQMYYHGWKSEYGKIPMYDGVQFMDNKTSKVVIDTSFAKTFVEGKTHFEYLNKFTPYISKNNPTYLERDIFPPENKIFDLDLLNYTIENSDSYVSLWFLIRQFNVFGYKDVYEKTLNSFSKKIKSEKLWNILNDEFQNIKIKENQKFPEIELQNTDLKKETFTLTESEYTLVDFWFSRCRPCLEQVPQLKKIYESYKNKGFNIIAISVDRSENIELWNKRIIEKEIPWKNYLDENGEISLSEKIISYPTNYLLDKNGIIIQRNIELDELEKLLSEKLR
jgi:thiol-disulfide isomerase/thioredoxin